MITIKIGQKTSEIVDFQHVKENKGIYIPYSNPSCRIVNAGGPILLFNEDSITIASDGWRSHTFYISNETLNIEFLGPNSAQ